jgi:hypothetical protein
MANAIMQKTVHGFHYKATLTYAEYISVACIGNNHNYIQLIALYVSRQQN